MLGYCLAAIAASCSLPALDFLLTAALRRLAEERQQQHAQASAMRERSAAMWKQQVFRAWVDKSVVRNLQLKFAAIAIMRSRRARMFTAWRQLTAAALAEGNNVRLAAAWHLLDIVQFPSCIGCPNAARYSLLVGVHHAQLACKIEHQASSISPFCHCSANRRSWH